MRAFRVNSLLLRILITDSFQSRYSTGKAFTHGTICKILCAKYRVLPQETLNQLFVGIYLVLAFSFVVFAFCLTKCTGTAESECLHLLGDHQTFRRNLFLWRSRCQRLDSLLHDWSEATTQTWMFSPNSRKCESKMRYSALFVDLLPASLWTDGNLPHQRSCQHVCGIIERRCHTSHFSHVRSSD